MRLVFLLLGATAILCLGGVGGLGAQESETCLMCHSNASFFTGLRDPGRLVVTKETLARSVHGEVGLECTTCHAGLEFPHPADRPRVECGSCHSGEGRDHQVSLHGQAAARGDPLAPSCTTCHGVHDVLRPSDPRSPTRVMNIPFLCGSCHREGAPVALNRDIPQDRILQNYSLSIHGEGLFRQGLTVTAVCTSCHTSHRILPHTDPASSIHRDNVAATCSQCHTQIEQVHRQVIEGRLWQEEPHKIPACVDCHAPHRIRRVFYDAGTANEECLRCHRDPALRGIARGDSMSLYVDEELYGTSVHGETACARCHTDVTPSRTVRACATVSSQVDCSICHAEPVEQYGRSTHGALAAGGDPDAPTCQDCHEKHAELPRSAPVSPTFARNVPALCATCHQKGKPAAERIQAAPPGIVEGYEMSIHGKGLLESGLTVTATCTSCHTAHLELPKEDSASSVNRDNVAGTCGTCHHGIEEAFETSIHWPGREDSEAKEDLPGCNDCHTSHTISRTDRSDFRLMMMDQCGRCHEEESETFFDTFHGKVSRLGDARAAKCYDCHGTHNIHPVEDARSTLSRRNIVETCAKCHPGANRRFTGYLTHATHHDPAKYPFLFWAFWGMTALLVGTLTFASAHTLAWLWRLSRSPGEWRRRPLVPASGPAGGKVYRRFTTFQRTTHLVMLLSFFTLAITGMMLKFSHMGWAQTLSGLLGGFATTGILHRLGAVTLITIFVVHLRDVRRQKRDSGLTWRRYLSAPNSLLFNRRDLTEFWQSIKWFLGKAKRPRYGRYTYWEKFDYFAVFWGMMVIGSTGFILWFPEVFTIVLPGWIVNVVTIIHSDEALLAVAFIFTIHFFNTHFRPDKFPMDPVIFTGHVPLEELKQDKPREYEEMVAEGRLEQNLVEPMNPRMEKAARVFGYSALAVGITLIVFILYSMVFGYR